MAIKQSSEYFYSVYIPGAEHYGYGQAETNQLDTVSHENDLLRIRTNCTREVGPECL